MKKNLITLVSVATLIAMATPAMASTVTGSLSTGMQTGLTGIVDAGVSASPVPLGTYTKAQSVVLTAAGSDSIYYTIDGTDPSCAPKGTKYVGAISVSSSETIRAVACFGTTASPVGKFAYGINISAPTNSGGGGGGGGSIVTTPTTLIGDINGDGVVDIKDFNLLLVQWGQTGPSLSADLNHNGVVGIGDFTLLMANWTK